MSAVHGSQMVLAPFRAQVIDQGVHSLALSGHWELSLAKKGL